MPVNPVRVQISFMIKQTNKQTITNQTKYECDLPCTNLKNAKNINKQFEKNIKSN